MNPTLNQSTIQGPPDVQRTATGRDAQPSRPVSSNDATPVSGAPEQSPTAVPDAREQPVIHDNQLRQSTEVVPSRARHPHISQ